MAIKLNTSNGSITLDAEDGSGNVNLTVPRAGFIEAWTLEDDDGTEVNIGEAKEVKFIGSGVTTNWTDTDSGADGDPYDLTFTVDAAQTGITSVYATDLIMGEDAQTAIDFGTADEIDFKVDNAARLTMTSGSLYPVTTNQIDLGTASLEFKDAFFTGTVTSDAFSGPLTGDVTGNASGTALTVTQAAQTAITSVGTLTALTVDNLGIDGNTVVANSGALNLTPAAGSAIVLDGTISIDAGVVTGATSITSTAFVGDVTGTASLATVTDSTADTNFPVVFHNESDALLDDTGALRYNPSTGTLLVPNLSVSGTTTQVDTVTMNAQNAVVFEGATADAHETTLSIVDPTADHTQYLINQGGYIPVLAAVSTTAISSTPEELNKLDALSRGSIIYGNASGATTVLTKGTTDQILTSDGTDISWEDPAASGISMGKAIAAAIVFG